MGNPSTVEEESTEIASQRITFFEYFFVFVLIIYAGRANAFVESLSISKNPVWTLFPIILSGVLALRWGIILALPKQFYLLIFGYFIYFIAVSIKYKEIHPTVFLDIFLSFFIVAVVVQALKLNLFRIYEYLLYILAIIALAFWGIQTMLGGDSLYYLLRKIPGIDLFSNVSGFGLNAIIYSVQPSYTSMLYGFAIPRNCGYAWEPGAFSVFICLAIFINLFLTNSDNRSKLRLWVLVIALLSTQSTTGYLIFLVIILYYLLNKNLYIVILLIPVVVISLVLLFSLPFMSEKVVDIIDETKGIDQLVINTYGRETSATPQRFTSFLIAFKDFRNNPVLGVRGNREDTWTYKIGSNISTISGIGNLLAQFGLVGFLTFIIITFKTSHFFSKYYNYSGKYLLFFIVLFISISYTVLLLPLVMCFWMFRFFSSDELDQIETKNLVSNIKSTDTDT